MDMLNREDGIIHSRHCKVGLQISRPLVIEFLTLKLVWNHEMSPLSIGKYRDVEYMYALNLHCELYVAIGDPFTQ